VVWKLDGCSVICAKKFRASTYSIVYYYNNETRYWFNREGWNFANITIGYRGLLKCKSGKVFKTLCDESIFTNWESFTVEKIKYSEKVELNLALAKSKMTC
jgi:hypothetical protein